MSESKTIRVDEKNQGQTINLGEEKSPKSAPDDNPSEAEAQGDVRETINTALEAVSEYAVQLKGRAVGGKIRGAITIEFGVDPKDGRLRRVGAVSIQEMALAALLIQQMAVGNLVGTKGD